MSVATSAHDAPDAPVDGAGSSSGRILRITLLTDIIQTLRRHHPHVIGAGMLERAIERRRIAQAIHSEEHRMTFCLVVRTSPEGKVECGALTTIPKPLAENTFTSYGPAPMLFGFLFGFGSYAEFRDVFEEIGRIGLENNRRRITGPFEATINYSCGLLEAKPSFPMGILMPHNPVEWNEYFAQFGFMVAERLFTFEIEFARAKFKRLSSIASQLSLTLKKLAPPFSTEERAAIVEVFNAGWRNNWGFVPFDVDFLEKIEKEFSPILWPGLSILAYHRNRPIGILVAVPDLNEVTRAKPSVWGLNRIGRGWRFFVRRRVRAVRVLILGLHPEFHGSREGASIIELMLDNGKTAAERYAATHVQFGWTLSSNYRVNRLVELWAPDAHRVVHRVWQSSLPYETQRR